MIKTCQRCGQEFDGHHNAKYCGDCRRLVRNENKRRRYHANIEVERAKSLQRYHARFDTRPPRIKTCEACGQPFEAKTNAKYCPTCRKVKQREAVNRYRAANPDKVREARRRWQQEHRARYNEQQRKWREANCRETPAREVTDQREKKREANRRYYAAHREQARQRYDRERLRKQRQQTLAKFLEWRKRNEDNRTVR